MGNLSLMMVLAFLMGYSYMGFRIRSTEENVTDVAVQAVRRSMLKFAASSAINRALSDLTVNPMLRNDITGTISGAAFRVRIYDSNTDHSLAATQVKLVSAVSLGGYRDTSIVLLQYPYFSRFAYITNTETSGIFFATGDTLRGPIHTNTYFSMMGRPAFMDAISSAQRYSSSQPYRTSGTTNPYFGATPNWDAPTLTFPTDVTAQRSAAASGGVVFSNTTLYVQFNSDGTYSTKTTATGAWVIRSKPANGIIYVGPTTGTGTGYTVNVSGRVSGQYTLAVQGSMNVTGDITYADDPRTNPGSTDILGLVAARNIALTNNTAGDRTIMAHIMTLNPTAGVTTNFYNSTYNSVTSGTLHLYGGVGQMARGAVAQTGSVRYGYLKDYRYDERLRDFSPPGYPNATVLQQIYYWE